MAKFKNKAICVVCGKPIEGEDRTCHNQKTHPGECREKRYSQHKKTRNQGKNKRESSALSAEEWAWLGRPKPRPRVVKCLGHGPDHYFTSPDPSRVRLCPNCRQRNQRIEGGDNKSGVNKEWGAKKKGASI